MTTLAPSFFIATSSFLQETMTRIKAWMSPNFNHIRPLTMELPALERLKKQYIMLSTLYRLHFYLILFIFAGNKDNYKSQMSSKFSQNQPWTAELAALDQLKKSSLKTIQNSLMTCCLSGERRCPLRFLFFAHLIFQKLMQRVS